MSRKCALLPGCLAGLCCCAALLFATAPPAAAQSGAPAAPPAELAAPAETPAATPADAGAARPAPTPAPGAQDSAGQAPPGAAEKPSSQPAAQAQTRGFKGGLLDLYALNRVTKVPNFITADLLLVAHALLEQQSLRQVEQTLVQPALESLLDRLITGLQAQPKAGDASDRATTANLEFLAVLRALLRDESDPSGAADSERARGELALARAGEGIALSPLWGVQIDYSQLEPRGDYAEDPRRSAFFRATRYGGLALFAFRPSKATGVTETLAERAFRQAVQLAELLDDDPEAAAAYSDLEETLAWWFGPPDDLTLGELAQVLATKDGEPPATREQVLDYAAKNGRLPRILGGIVDVTALDEGQGWQDVMIGLRLLPSRSRADSVAFQALVYDRVGDYRPRDASLPPPITLGVIAGQAVKAYPSALELMALLGSNEARTRLGRTQATAFDGYEQAAAEAVQALGAASGREGMQLAMLHDWLAAAADDADTAAARLQGALGYWTRQRWQSLLYDKQSYTPAGKGVVLPSDRPGAWIEPAAAVYAGLSRLTERHREQLDDPAWRQMAEILARVSSIADEAEAGGPLDQEDERFLNNLDRELMRLVGSADRPVVVDVHTSPATGEVLEEALGHAAVVYHRPGQGPVARGARMTHYEFREPIPERMDDAAWIERLNRQGPPAPPPGDGSGTDRAAAAPGSGSGSH